MTTRRDFLRGSATAAAGVVFCGCGLLHRANAQTPARQTLPVKVAGKTIKTIDVHSHCHFREAGTLLGADAAKALGVSEADVGSSLEAGDLKGKRIGSQWRITKSALADFLK